MKEYLNDVRMVGQGDGARNHLNKKKKSEAFEHGGACNIQYWKETSERISIVNIFESRDRERFHSFEFVIPSIVDTLLKENV